MMINFIESNPIPVKSAMAAMGLLEEVYRLPMVPPRPESKAKLLAVLQSLKLRRAAPAMTLMSLETESTALRQAGDRADHAAARDAFTRLRAALSAGTARAAEPDPSSPTGWRVNAWVKRGILLGFRFGDTVDMTVDHGRWPFFDKDTLPLKNRSRRRRAHRARRIERSRWRVLGRGVICMPPMYINIGAYVGDGTLVDSHALVGSCAQIGSRVHLSAGAQIGGVLEPVGALPVIIEDDVMVGGNCGVYEGAVIKRRAVLAAGTIMTASTPLYDLPNGRSSSRRPIPPSSCPKEPSSYPARGR